LFFAEPVAQLVGRHVDQAAEFAVRVNISTYRVLTPGRGEGRT
jgi:hypothetical protein